MRGCFRIFRPVFKWRHGGICVLYHASKKVLETSRRMLSTVPRHLNGLLMAQKVDTAGCDAVHTAECAPGVSWASLLSLCET